MTSGRTITDRNTHNHGPYENPAQAGSLLVTSRWRNSAGDRPAQRRKARRKLRLLEKARSKGIQIMQLDAQGALDPATRRMPVSLVVNPDEQLEIMQEEIFGPMLVVKPYDSLDEAIAYINRGERPLALYVFTNDSKIAERVQRQTFSGGFCVNTCAMHGAVHSLGFGGVGRSGTGRHHGIDGFREFSNPRGVFVRGRGGIAAKVFVPPYTRFAQRMANFAIAKLRLKLRGFWASLWSLLCPRQK